MKDASIGARHPGDPRAWLWLGCAALLLVVASGRWALAPAVWLAPLFLIRFLRGRRPWPGLLIGALAYTLPCLIASQGFFPFTGVTYVSFVVGVSLIAFLPYVADRLLAPRLGGFLGTLVFPLAWTTLEYVSALTGPFGTWGSLAYTQFGLGPLVQIVSVTGLWGLTFLITWFGPLANWVWEAGVAWPRIRWGVGLYAAICLAVLLFGAARLVLSPPPAEGVRVAGIARPADFAPDAQVPGDLFTQLRDGLPLTSPDLARLQADFQAGQGYLLTRTTQEAQAGARVIFWAEGNARVFAADEAALLERGRALARTQQIYLGMALGVVHPGQQPAFENKVVLVAPDGNILWQYEKSHLVPGTNEALDTMPGDHQLRVADTPYGRIGAVICYDQDFLDLVRQAGEQHVDLLVIPSNDWPEVAPIHMQMATFHAVEQGFVLLRPTSNGLAVAADPLGRVVSVANTTTGGDGVLLATVPVHRVSTLYARVGDLVAWLCVVGFFGLVAAALWPAARLRRLAAQPLAG